MKNPKIVITNHIPAYKFRKKYQSDPKYRERLLNVSNRGLMVALYFHNRLN